MQRSTDARTPTAAQVAHAFLRPRRPEAPQPLVIPGGEAVRIDTPEGEVVLQRGGQGPAVLLLHGWEGQASDMAAFVPPLLSAGCTVVAMHLPAHGDSPGTQSSIPLSARALLTVGDKLGPLHGAIAHSIGSAVLGEALHLGLAAQRLVMIAAPAHYEHYARATAAGAGLNAEETEAMLGLLSSAMQVDLTEVSLPRRAPLRHEPALFIHSEDDRVVSIRDSLATASAWPGARHHRVEGLGHRRILSDAAVVAAAVAFVTPTP